MADWMAPEEVEKRRQWNLGYEAATRELVDPLQAKLAAAEAERDEAVDAYGLWRDNWNEELHDQLKAAEAVIEAAVECATPCDLSARHPDSTADRTWCLAHGEWDYGPDSPCPFKSLVDALAHLPSQGD